MIAGKSWKGACVDAETVARTSLLSVTDWMLPVYKNARVLVISPALKLSAAEARSFWNLRNLHGWNLLEYCLDVCLLEEGKIVLECP